MRLCELALDHIEASDYADRVIGYRFAAGNTRGVSLPERPAKSKREK